MPFELGLTVAWAAVPALPIDGSFSKEFLIA